MVRYKYASAINSKELEDLSQDGFRIAGVSPSGSVHMQCSITQRDYQQELVDLSLHRALTSRLQTLESIHEKIVGYGDTTRTATGKARVLQSLNESEDVVIIDGKYKSLAGKKVEDPAEYTGVIYG